MAKHILVELTVGDAFADLIAATPSAREKVEYLIDKSIVLGAHSMIDQGEVFEAHAVAQIFNAKGGGPNPRILTEDNPL